MNYKHHYSKAVLTLLFVTAFLFTTTGCFSDGTEDANAIAYVSPVYDSDYQNTFQDLPLGVIYEYSIKRPTANKSWVYVWVEGYKNGELVKSKGKSYLSQLSYGGAPDDIEVSEGKLVFGILDATDDLFFFYSHTDTGTFTLGPHEVDNNPINSNKVSGMSYSIEEALSLRAGETRIIGAYLQDGELIPFNLNEPEKVDRMIQENEVVLLIKIKVEAR